MWSEEGSQTKRAEVTVLLIVNRTKEKGEKVPTRPENLQGVLEWVSKTRRRTVPSGSASRFVGHSMY